MTPDPAIGPPNDSDDVLFPENRNYGCVNCGSINHTTGDKDWCPKERWPKASDPPFNRDGYEDPNGEWHLCGCGDLIPIGVEWCATCAMFEDER